MFFVLCFLTCFLFLVDVVNALARKSLRLAPTLLWPGWGILRALHLLVRRRDLLLLDWSLVRVNAFDCCLSTFLFSLFFDGLFLLLFSTASDTTITGWIDAVHGVYTRIRGSFFSLLVQFPLWLSCFLCLFSRQIAFATT